MTEPDVVDAFTQISPVYDATRAPLDEGTLDTIAAKLHERHVVSALEVGVGTGRIAQPMSERGFEITGVDASPGMLAHARAKGVGRLVRGNAYQLPFRPASVDTTLFVHVLHLLDDPVAALQEACRVGRQGATALVRPPRDDADATGPRSENGPRRVVAEILAREGYPIHRRGGTGGPRRQESRLLRAVPPDRLEVVVDRTETEPLGRRLDMIEMGAARGFLHVPPEVLRRAVIEARAQVSDRTVTYRRVEALATWNRAPPPTTIPIDDGPSEGTPSPPSA
ncbi:MAG: class I SAM-dependent methyltransferase [Thermoplasmata archaeon]|nr:class I SAM-dependent methyltransferase [Thermoplasmata archaeon]